MFNAQSMKRMKENSNFLYIGSNSGSFMHEDATDYYDKLAIAENKKFIEDYESSDEIILYCGQEYHPSKVMVRLQKTFDYRQVSIQELFILLGKEQNLFDDIFEAKKIRTIKGIFKRPSYSSKIVFSSNGKQLLSNYLGKRIIYYDAPEQNHSDYNPERFNPQMN